MTFMTNHYLLGIYGFSGVSQILSAIIASERCFCILQPLRSQTVLRTSTMTAIIVTVNVLVVGLYFLVLARYNIVCAYNPISDNVIMTMVGGKFYLRHKKTMDFLFVLLYGAGYPSFVMVVVTTTTIITAVKLRQAAAWRAGTSSSGSVSPREIALTRMLVYNSVFFIVCVLPIALFRSVSLLLKTNKQADQQKPLFTSKSSFHSTQTFRRCSFQKVLNCGMMYNHFSTSIFYKSGYLPPMFGGVYSELSKKQFFCLSLSFAELSLPNIERDDISESCVVSGLSATG